LSFLVFSTTYGTALVQYARSLHKKHDDNPFPYGRPCCFCAAFPCMQKTMLIFWVILMHLQSANLIGEVFVPLVGGLFMWLVCFWKKETTK